MSALSTRTHARTSHVPYCVEFKSTVMRLIVLITTTVVKIKIKSGTAEEAQRCRANVLPNTGQQNSAAKSREVPYISFFTV